MRKLKNKKYHYFYKITNNINNHFYYGIHSTDDLDDGYMGSGVRLNYAYKKYGIENFSKEILKFFNSREECAEYEAEMVTEQLVHDDNCYNVSCGGEYFNTLGTVSVRDKDGKCFRVSKYDEKYLSNEYIPVAYNHVIAIDKTTNIKVSIPKDEYYKNKDRYLSGNFPVFVKLKSNPEMDFFLAPISEYQNNKDLYINKNSEYHLMKDKLGNNYYARRDDPRYLSGELVSFWKGRKHSDETKQKISETFKNNKHQQGEKNSQFGTCWIYKDGENMKIKKEELEIYIQQGWIKGRKIKK